jgi:putative aldouronate transport system substrate-binding protein
MISPLAHDGGAPINYLTGGFGATNVLKQASPDRIKELLRIADWLSAPFGSQEDLLLTYGLKDQDYTLDANGNPVPTQAGKMNAGYMPWMYISQHPQVSYQADLPGFAKAAWDAEHVIIPTGVLDPTLGLDSATSYKSGATAAKAVSDGLNDLILGRQPMSNYEASVKAWQTQAGNQIRSEYLAAMA